MADFESSRAVIVGINAYSNGILALRSAVNDAEDLAKILEADHGYSVTRLLDGEATRDSLARHFEQVLPQQVGDDDRLLVYFAGHGIALEGEDGPKGYVLPQDARTDDRASFLAMETLHGWLGKLRCRHLLVVLDCCFAGAFRWAKETRHIRAPLAEMHRERYERYTRNPARQVIASTAYDQKALDTIADGDVLGRRRSATDDASNSPFARALFEGLKGEADLVPKNGDGVIVAYELATFLQDSVSRCADDTRHDQMPCIWPLGKEGSGQFIFLLPHFDPDKLKPAPVLDAENNPYRGLSAYEEKHASLFFGRERVVEDLAEVVKKQPLTMVLGASGTGKSSLVRAGLLSYPCKIAAAVVAGDGAEATDAVLFGKDPVAGGTFHRLLMRPADAPTEPVRELMTQLSRAGSSAPPSPAPSGDVIDETPAAALAVISAWLAADLQRHLLLVIDQFEELITLCHNRERTAFLKFLADLLDRERDRLRIVLTLRSDFEPQVADSALQRHLQNGEGTREARFVVPPLRHHELREIIEKPASERVLSFEPPALVDRLITEVIQMPGALPLLSFALSELYLAYVHRQRAAQRCGEIIDRAITEEDYRQLGGVFGTLNQRASEEYDVCDAEYRRTMQRVMLRMVATEGELARRRVSRDELVYPQHEETERARAVVERLQTARLVVSGRTEGSEAANGDGHYVEAAHDALIRSWGKLLDWQREAAADLPVQRRLTEAANEWQRRKRDSGLLWTSDPRLALVREQLSKPDSWLNALETDFVAASAQRRRRNKWVAWAAVVGLVVLTASSLIAAFKAVEQQNAAKSNHSRAITALAKIEAETGSTATAVRLALAVTEAQTGSTATTVRTETDMFVGSLLLQLWEWRRLKHNAARSSRPDGRTLSVNSVAFSPDGGTLATASPDDNTVRLWDATGQFTGISIRHGDAVNSVAFSPDGGTLATGSEDNTARLWDVATGNEIKILRDHELPVRSVAFSPDGGTLATGSEDNTARLWDVATGNEIKILRDHELPVRSVAFSPDGRTLATGSEDNTARLWDVATGNEIKILRGHEYPVRSVAFSLDGGTLATGSEDDSARLWDVATGNEIKILRGHENSVSSVAFSPDGGTLATGSEDNTARRWDVATGNEINILRGHGDVVLSVAFSPDGGTLATGSGDGTARLWKSPPLPRRLDHEDAVRSVAFSPDGGTLATGSEDNTARLWDVATGNEVKILRGHGGVVLSVAFSPDGGTLATGSEDNTARLWDVATGNEIKILRGHGGVVLSVAFSPDGGTLATGSWDNTARLWDVATGEIKELQGHTSSVSAVAFSPDGGTLATGSWDNTARLWDVATGEIKELQGHTSSVSAVAFSPDGRTLATGSEDHTARLWEVATGKEIANLPDNNQVWSVAFAPGGHILATGSLSNAIRFWGVETDQEIAVMTQGHSVLSVAFSPDGNVFATGSEDKKVWLWPLYQQPIRNACARVHNLPLSERERQRFGIEDEWCTPEVSAELRTKLGLDKPETSASAVR